MNSLEEIWERMAKSKNDTCDAKDLCLRTTLAIFLLILPFMVCFGGGMRMVISVGEPNF
jgi:hypothetical protein